MKKCFLLRFLNHQPAFVGLLAITLLVLGVSLSSLLTKYNPVQQGDLLTERYLSPSNEHLFGTDKFGRDVFSRVLHGGRISLTIAFSVVLMSITIGLIYGSLSGYFGGLIDSIMMRILDFLLAFPVIFLIIAVAAIFQVSHWYLIPLLSLTGWMETARLVRAEVLSVRERDFILAAKGLGFTHGRVLMKHIIPNCLTPVIVAATLKVGEVILLESALSFLGIGVRPPSPSWGNIINDGRQVLMSAWWVATFPGIFIVLAVMSFNLVSDGLRQAFDLQR